MRRLKMSATTTAAALLRSTASPTPPLFFPPPLLPHRRRSISSVTAAPPSPLSQTLHHQYSSSSGVEGGGIIVNDSEKIILKGMRYKELENWVTSQGYRPTQALMLWKRLYGNNSNSIWAHSSEELEGLNKDFKTMLGKCAKFKAVRVKDIVTASDGTRKEVADFVYIG